MSGRAKKVWELGIREFLVLKGYRFSMLFHYTFVRFGETAFIHLMPAG
jgi:hypothetical protein